ASRELLEGFLQHLRVERALSVRTLVNYSIDIERYLRYLDESALDPLRVTRETLTDYLWKRKAAGVEATSIARYMASLRAFYRFLLAEGHVKADPSALLKSPRKAERLPRYLTIEETSRLLTAVGSTKERNIRLRAMLELMYAAGLRVSELLGVRLDGV